MITVMLSQVDDALKLLMTHRVTIKVGSKINKNYTKSMTTESTDMELGR